ncbi:penicillin-binding protein 2 [Verrucomicrobiota bacterium sgz303538]
MARRRRLRRPSAELRIYFLAFVMVLGLGALVAKLWWEQVARGKDWTKKIASRSEVTVRIPSVRGEIRDRNGITLVGNRASYEVDFYLPDMVRGFKQQNGHLPLTTYTAPVRQMLKEKKEADIVQIVNTSIVPRLQELDLAKDYNAERLQKHYRNDTEVPFTYLEEIDFKTIAKFAEHDVGLPGVDISLRPVREYVYGALASHLLGYVGAPNDIDKLPDIDQYTFYQPDVEGKSQIEKSLDKWIRGKPGVRIMQRNVKGVIESEVKRVSPEQGNNVYLTIDARIQYIAERALRQGGIGRGAAVVANPNNGEILAMASVPSYDPNVFIPSISKANWDKLDDDETNPLTNRAIQSYAPGSTFKTVTGLAGLRKGMTIKNTFNCSGGVTYGNKFMGCWVIQKHMAPHGTLTLPDALKHSCNAFFYQWGNAAGIDQIDAVGDALGLGHKTGVPLTGESPGILPGPEWLKRINPNERWSNGYTANVSIGQGSCEASPLQMAMVVSTIANRGISFEPRMIYRVLDQAGRDVVDPDTNQLVAPHEPKVRANLHDAGITEDQVELIRRGMWKVVNDQGGTGKRAQVKGVEVAGKTGTAQFWREVKGRKEKDNHTWFICFAPYDKPKYAITIMVEGGKSGGGTAAPIAQKIMEESLALEKGFDPQLARLEPAVGHFKSIEDVKYEKSDVPTDMASTDEETADHTEPPPEPETKQLAKKKKQVDAKPDIRSEPDARGRVAAPRGQPPVRKAPEERRNFFQRFFGPRRAPEPAPAPQGRGR